MTTQFGVATFAAVSSAVLFFGNAANVEGHPFLGNPPSLVSISEMSEHKPVLQPPTEISNPAPTLILVPKIEENLPKPIDIATETKAPDIIQHPVTDPSNAYVWGQCTWYVKNKRPDLPNNLGNANTWYSGAAAAGYTVSSTPYAGAVGTTTEGAYGHVVYVESVNADGTVNISEMNYAGGVGVVHYRTTPASAFAYIY